MGKRSEDCNGRWTGGCDSGFGEEGGWVGSASCCRHDSRCKDCGAAVDALISAIPELFIYLDVLAAVAVDVGCAGDCGWVVGFDAVPVVAWVGDCFGHGVGAALRS